MQLPRHHKLPVNHLAAVFNKTTATYKFYWFMSLLELLVERGNTRIPIRDILIRMICNSWYPVNYFKVSFAIFDKYPVSPGHVLVIPRRHCSSYFNLTPDEQSACWQLLNDVAAIIRERFTPAGFNIGRAAGQTVDHVHIHLIPRYDGDIEAPGGGVRGVIPSNSERKKSIG